MYTIKNNSKYELIIKNSKFITLLYKINTDSDVTTYLNKTKEIYKDATHYCYAYILDNYKKVSDDGEPSGTAGIPILKVIEANNLTNILILVVRYFGGIKLGANGLIRAYTKCTANAIKENEIIELTKGINLNIIFPYNKQKEIDYLLKDIKIIDKKYDDNIIYNINIKKDFLDTIINNNINYEIIKNINIEK